MASPFTRCVRPACGVAALAWFVACGGSSDPGLFSASSSAGTPATSNHAGALSAGGGSTRGGAPSSGGSSTAGDGSTAGGATNGGSAGASNAGFGGAALAGASNAGAANGGSAGASGGAPHGGSAGSIANAGGGSGGETCQTLFAKASKQLAAAQVCNFAADSMQCTATVKNLCKCEVPVNREGSAETKAYQDTLAQLDEKECVQVCTALACLPATHATCKVSTPGGATGSCVANYGTQF